MQGFAEKEAVILAAVRAYPLRRLLLHLDVGVGLGRYRAAYWPVGADRQEMKADAPAVAVGAGDDVRVGERLVVVPQISLRKIASSSLTVDRTPLLDSGFSTLAIGAALRWRVVALTVEREPR